MAPTRTPTKKTTAKRPQKAKKESIEFHHLASRLLLGKGPPKQRSAALITPTKSSSKRVGAQLNCSAKSFSPSSVSLTPAKPRKLFFSFDLCSRTYQGLYSYTEFMEQAKIFLQHKYYFLPKELITARAKSMWNKRMEEVMSQKAAGGSGNANCKSEALARKQQQQPPPQPKPTTASLPRRKNFVDESCEADNEDEVEETKEEEEETAVTFSKPTTPAPRSNRPRRPKESLTTLIEEVIDDSPMEEEEEQAKENEDESTVIYFSTDSARDASAEDASAEDASVEDASVEDASAEDASAEDASVVDASVEDASAEDSSAEVASPAAADDNNNNNPKINVLLSEPVIVDLGPALSESSSLSTHS